METKVIIDAGHGIDTPGKRSPKWADGSILYEYKFNREIALRLHHDLKAHGVNSIILNPEIEDVPLQERVNRVKTIHRENPSCILVSIHANAGGGTGWECFTRTTASKKLGDVFSRNASTLLAGAWRNRGHKQANFAILNTPCPSVLTENFFMDTQKDCEFIQTEKGKRLVTRLHVKSILEYLCVNT